MEYYRRAFLAMLAFVASTILVVTSDDLIEPIEIVNLAIGALAAFAVYVTPEAPGYGVIKGLVLALGAGLQYVASAIQTDSFDLTGSLWAQIAATMVGAVLVVAVPQPSLPQPPPAQPTPTTA